MQYVPLLNSLFTVTLHIAAHPSDSCVYQSLVDLTCNSWRDL
jgi:hypothetical protein